MSVLLSNLVNNINIKNTYGGAPNKVLKLTVYQRIGLLFIGILLTLAIKSYIVYRTYNLVGKKVFNKKEFMELSFYDSLMLIFLIIGLFG